MPVHRRVTQVIGCLWNAGYAVEEDVLLLADGLGAVDAAESLFAAAALPESEVLEPDELESLFVESVVDEEEVDEPVDPPSPDPRESVR